MALEPEERNPSVSVIVPVYNAEPYLRQCLESVLRQSLREIELICVDDGAEDASGAICEAYAAQDARIRVLHQENRGAGAARNAGLAAARGTYLAFLDADDLYAPQALEKAYARACGSGAEIVLFGAAYCDGEGALLFREEPNRRPLGNRTVFSAREAPRYFFQVTSCNTWNKLFRREFVLAHALRFQEIRTANDLCFVYAAMARAERIALLPEDLVRHRVLRGANLQSRKSASPADFLTALEAVRRDLAELGLWEALERSFRNCVVSHCLFNYRTLDRAGRRRLSREGARIEALLGPYPESWYEDAAGCRQIRQWLAGEDGRELGFKNFLKKFLPPPVNTFNREMGVLKQYVSEQNAGVLAEQRQLLQMLQQQQSVLEQIERQQSAIEAEQKRQEENGAQMRRRLELLADQEVRSVADAIQSVSERQDELRRQAAGTAAQVDALQKTLPPAIERNRQQIARNARYIQETIWGEIFNNTIPQSEWLKDKTFSPGRWAVGYPFLYALYRVLDEARPRRILELGLGQTTRMIGQYAAGDLRVEHCIVEHDPEWIAFFLKDFSLPENSRIVRLDREMVQYREADAVRVFHGFCDAFAGQKFDCIVIDAPLGADMKEYSRIDVLQLLPECLSEDFVILLDDCERPGETRTLREMEARLDASGIAYARGVYHGEKDCAVLAAKHMTFLTSL